jgi:hypothetical protein
MEAAFIELSLQISSLPDSVLWFSASFASGPEAGLDCSGCGCNCRNPLEATGLCHVNTPCSITTVRTQILAVFAHRLCQGNQEKIWYAGHAPNRVTLHAFAL